MSYPDYELNEPSTQDDILKMLKLIYNKISSENNTNKLFYIKINLDGRKYYLNYYSYYDDYFLSNKNQTSDVQTQFTQEEIDKMKENKKFRGLNIEECKVPVEEEE